MFNGGQNTLDFATTQMELHKKNGINKPDPFLKHINILFDFHNCHFIINLNDIYLVIVYYLIK